VFTCFSFDSIENPVYTINPAIIEWSWSRFINALVNVLTELMDNFYLFYKTVITHSYLMIMASFAIPSLIMHFMNFPLSIVSIKEQTFWLLLILFKAVIIGLRIPTETIGNGSACPNQGIKQSFKNGTVVFIIIEAIYWLITVLSRNILIQLKIDSTLVASGVLLFALLVGSNLGLMTSIKHFILRFILYCNGYIPWNYARFLNYATNLIFLQKVGGGYIFIHRLLLEHFAQMEPEQVRR
jgi:hypothetical protein